MVSKCSLLNADLHAKRQTVPRHRFHPLSTSNKRQKKNQNKLPPIRWMRTIPMTIRSIAWQLTAQAIETGENRPVLRVVHSINNLRGKSGEISSKTAFSGYLCYFRAMNGSLQCPML